MIGSSVRQDSADNGPDMYIGSNGVCDRGQGMHNMDESDRQGSQDKSGIVDRDDDDRRAELYVQPVQETRLKVEKMQRLGYW